MSFGLTNAPAEISDPQTMSRDFINNFVNLDTLELDDTLIFSKTSLVSLWKEVL